MDKDVLATVIETEKEIEERLEREKEKAAQWLENVGKEIEAETAAEVRKMEDSQHAAVAAAREAAEKRASLMLREVQEQSRRLSRISDETLKRIIGDHLDRIRP
jgi:Skp family chaperone for outer membrane proteins